MNIGKDNITVFFQYIFYLFKDFLFDYFIRFYCHNLIPID